jgi:ectoine hydroxylase-related dioxygenase (phytanoyl-CoA dioxygenase family)
MSSLITEGRAWLRGALDEATLRALDANCDTGEAPGQRLLLEPPVALNALAQSLLSGARPVRVVAFNKSDANNWTLPWHQDRVVALRERVDAPGFGNWTNKAGIWHAEPPIEFLERMLFARVHLDPADPESGCLQVALGTHARGKIAAADAEAVANAAPIEDCVAARGDVLFAKALILHRSAPSRTSNSRRAIRIDYCAEPLPEALTWAA